ALDRVWQTPVEACPHRRVVAAESGDDGLLAFLDDEDARAHPDDDDHDGDQAGADARTLHVGLETSPAAIAATSAEATPAFAAAPATEQASELAVEVAPELVEIRRALVGATVVPAAFEPVAAFRPAAALGPVTALGTVAVGVPVAVGALVVVVA